MCLLDDRNFPQMFLSILCEKIIYIQIFKYPEYYNHISMTFSFVIFSLELKLFMNGLLFSDNIIHEKYENKGNLNKLTTIILSILSTIFSVIILNILKKYLTYPQIIKLIKKHVQEDRCYKIYYFKLKSLLKKSAILYGIITNIFSLFIVYYLVLFGAIYTGSQLPLIINYLIGLIETIGVYIIISFILSLLRYISIRFHNENLFNFIHFINHLV